VLEMLVQILAQDCVTSPTLSSQGVNAMNTSNDKIDSVLEKPLKMNKRGSKTLMAPNGKKVKTTTRSDAVQSYFSATERLMLDRLNPTLSVVYKAISQTRFLLACICTGFRIN
jgi:uncharacterized lipoprotein YajG